jgi:hypothetical protein
MFSGSIVAFAVHFMRLNESFYSVCRIILNIPRALRSLSKVIGIRAMSRKEIVALKLQMGISPAVRIDARTLQAMWRQLNLECTRKPGNGPGRDPNPNLTVYTPFEA